MWGRVAWGLGTITWVTGTPGNCGEKWIGEGAMKAAGQAPGPGAAAAGGDEDAPLAQTVQAACVGAATLAQGSTQDADRTDGDATRKRRRRSGH